MIPHPSLMQENKLQIPRTITYPMQNDDPNTSHAIRRGFTSLQLTGQDSFRRCSHVSKTPKAQCPLDRSRHDLPEPI